MTVTNPQGVDQLLTKHPCLGWGAGGKGSYMMAVRTKGKLPRCERCGGQCRTEKAVYGWVCRRSEDELDFYPGP